MNVLIAILKYPPDFTGAGLRIHNMYSRLKSREEVGRVIVLTTAQTEEKDHYEKKDGIDVFFFTGNLFSNTQRSLFKYSAKSFYVLSKIFHIIHRYLKIYHDVDIIHTIDSSWLSTLVGWLAFLTRKPLVKEIVLIGTDDPLTIKKEKGLFGRFIFLSPFYYANLIITISEPLRDICIKAGLPENKIWARHNPVYIESLSQIEIAYDAFEDFSFQGKNILFVGTLIQRKNIDFLLESAIHLKGDVNLLFAGPAEDKEYFHRLRTLASHVKDKTNNRVKPFFLGWVKDRKKLAWLFMKSDVSWFASKHEGMGNVIIESLLYGTPVVTLPVCGIMYNIIRSTQEGEIVEDSASPEKFASVVNRYLHNPKPNRQALMETAKMRFDPREIENKYLALMQGLVRGENS